MKRGFLAMSMADLTAYLIYVILLILFIVIFKVRGFDNPSVDRGGGTAEDFLPLHFIYSEIEETKISDYFREALNKCDNARISKVRKILDSYVWLGKPEIRQFLPEDAGAPRPDIDYSFRISKEKGNCLGGFEREGRKFDFTEKISYYFPDYDGKPVKIELEMRWNKKRDSR